MKLYNLLAVMCLCLVVAFAGCGDKKDDKKKAGGKTNVSNTNVELCADCGGTVGTEECCKQGATDCESCALHKGSALCCKGVAKHCKDCGQVAGSADCCKDGAKSCDKCGFHVGSALCCKGPVRGEKLTFCTGCGNYKSDGCCDKEGEECTDCGFHKGSFLCCKVKQADFAKKEDDK